MKNWFIVMEPSSVIYYSGLYDMHDGRLQITL